MSKRTPTQKSYTEPILCKSGEDWFVFFRYYHAGKWHPKKLRENLNRFKDPIEKERFGIALLEARHEWLKMGWNPILDPNFKLRNLVNSKDDKKEMTLNEALDYALSKKKLASKSKQDYENMLEFIKEVGALKGYGLLKIDKIDRGTCLDLLDECALERNFSNHAYNKYLSCMRSMFTVLVDRRIMDVNYLCNTTARDWPESDKYAAFTDAEKVKIANHLIKMHYRLYVFMQVVYHTGIRPKEALALFVEDVNMQERVITIAPDLERENSKTKKKRKVPINPHLHRLLSEMGLHNYPGNYYVFGSPFGKNGNQGRLPKQFEGGKPVYGAMRQDYFMPHPNHVKRDTVTKLWKKLIMDDKPTGLGIKKHLYAAKHTGADDMVEAGLELKEVQYLYGHESEAMTRRYNKKKKEIEMKESILAKSPAFAPKR